MKFEKKADLSYWYFRVSVGLAGLSRLLGLWRDRISGRQGNSSLFPRKISWIAQHEKVF